MASNYICTKFVFNNAGWEAAVSGCLDGWLVIYPRMVSMNAVPNAASSKSRYRGLRESSGGRYRRVCSPGVVNWGAESTLDAKSCICGGAGDEDPRECN